MINQSDTNQISNKVNNIQQARKVIDVIDDIEIVLPSVIHQDGQDEEGGINELNEKIENLCKEEGMRFIDKNNINVIL